MAQFAIVRMQKFQVSDVQGIQKHNQRQGISKSNPDIDYEKSDENYDFLNDQNLKYESKIKEEIAERVKRKPRANSVVLSEFLVTASPEYMNSLSAEEQKKYFEKSLEFIQERYEQKNTLYAVVHQDEAAPHMHVGVIPITEDGRLSAKDIFNRQELRELQEEFPKHLQEHDFEVVRGEKGSEKKHLSAQEYKEKQDLEREKQLIEKSLSEKKNELLDMSQHVPPELKIRAKKEKKTVIEDKLVHFGKPKTVEKETGNLVIGREEYRKMRGIVNAATHIKSDYDRLQTTDLVQENKKLTGENEQWKEKYNELVGKFNVNVRDYNELSKENDSLKERVADLKHEVGLIYQSAKEFLKERTSSLRAFKSTFKELVDKVKEKAPGSEFERLDKRERRREQDRGIER